MINIKQEPESRILNELLAILYGIAVATIVEGGAELLLDPSRGLTKPVPFALPPAAAYVPLTLSLVVLAVRFFHGNLQSIAKAASAGWSRGEEAYSFTVIVLQGVLFGAMGKLMISMQALYFCLIALFVLNMVLAAISGLDHRRITPAHQQFWAYLACVSLVLLLSSMIFFVAAWKMIVVTIALTTLVDYVKNWHFYFRRAPVSGDSAAL